MAHFLGLERVGATGKATPDLVGEHLVVEVKDRRYLPEWLLKALGSARAKAGADHLGVAVATSPSSDIDLVVMDLRDFRELLRKAGM